MLSLMSELKGILARDAEQSRQAVADRLAFRAYLRTGEVPVVIEQFRRATGSPASKFNSDQPRWPAGSPQGGGRWSPRSERSIGTVDDPAMLSTVAYDFGRLLEEVPYPGGRYCVYRFSFADVFVEGPRSFGCQQRLPSAAATHGTVLNDNYGD